MQSEEVFAEHIWNAAVVSCAARFHARPWLVEVLCSDDIAFLQGCALDDQEPAFHKKDVSPRCIVDPVHVRVRAFDGRQASDGFWQDKTLKLLSSPWRSLNQGFHACRNSIISGKVAQPEAARL